MGCGVLHQPRYRAAGNEASIRVLVQTGKQLYYGRARRRFLSWLGEVTLWGLKFQGEPQNVFWSDRTRNAEKQAACLKFKSNLPTLTIRGLKAWRQT